MTLEQLFASIGDQTAVSTAIGDQVKRDVANEKAARAILCGIDHARRLGSVGENSPLLGIDLPTARVIAKLALAGGLNYLAGKERV